MTQYINKAALIAEIERMQAKTSIGLNEYTAGYENGKAEVCGLLLNFISSLQKEPECEDLELASERYACRFSNSKYGCDKIKTAFKAGANWQEEQDNICYEEIFEEGAKWQKEQMLKDAVDANVSFGQPVLLAKPIPTNIAKDGDKVKLIIIKED